MSKISQQGLDSRLDEILLERIALGSMPMFWSLGVLTVLAGIDGRWILAGCSLTSQLIAAGVWRAIRRDRVRPALAGPISLGVWLAAEATVIFALVEYRGTTQEIWLALLLWAYGAMQLRAKWAYIAFFVGAVAWLAAALAVGLTQPLLHLVSIAAATAVAKLAFDANRAVLIDLEQLRAQDALRREELAQALQTARRELRERMEAEAEREKLREQFVRAQRMEAIGTLAGGVAHDMNNILAAVLGMAKLMRKTATGTDAEDLDTIAAAAERGAALTRSLLGFSRRAQYKKEALPLASVVDEALAMLRRTVAKGVTLTDHVDRDVWVFGDRGHLAQALLNICLNSVAATGEDGAINVIVRRDRLASEDAAVLEVPAGEYAVLVVEDDGCGMDEQVQKRVFEPFFSTKGVGKGSGLGLAMVWGTVKAHGGSARIDSEPGQGTRLACYLPLQPSPTPEADEAVTTTSRAASVERPPMRVLVVDDEQLLRETSTRILEHAGYRTSIAVDGVDALERFAAERKDIRAVVLDMSMPRMNGAVCYRRLRAIDPKLPIVCVSGYALDEETHTLLGSDVVFVPKPFSPAELCAAVEKVLGKVDAAA